MICPFCVEDVPAGTTQHFDCLRYKDTKFSKGYTHYHGAAEAKDPIIVSVVGSIGQGKTVYLCALFHFLDRVLTKRWQGFFAEVLDQASMNTLNKTRKDLENGILPDRTLPTFPRPGIFRLRKMPYSEWRPTMPQLEDTTILIYDPPGEAFESDSQMKDLASFVKRSSCVLFLIDITEPGDPIADKMAALLGTYVLGMREIGIQEQSQHLIVVYTKSDRLKSSVPEFADFLEQHPDLEKHMKELVPDTLKNPNEYHDHLTQFSKLLRDFTRDELNADKFISEADTFFKSVSFTTVSSLGDSPDVGRRQ